MSDSAEKKQELAQSLITNILLYKNPYDVFDADKDTPLDEIHRKYKKISLQIHPDKCKLPQAVDAFDILKKAMKILEEEQYEDQRKKYQMVMENSKKKMEQMWKEKGKVRKTEEDDRIFHKDCKKMTQKMLLDITHENNRAEEIRLSNERREKELKMKEAEKLQQEIELEKEWEQSRDNRVGQWRNFQTKVNPKKRKNPDDDPKLLQPKSSPKSTTGNSTNVTSIPISSSTTSSQPTPVPTKPPVSSSTAKPVTPASSKPVTPVSSKPVTPASSSVSSKPNGSSGPNSKPPAEKKKYIPKPIKPPKIKLS